MKTDGPQKQQPEPKRFHALLSELDDGGISAQLDAELQELMHKTLEVAISRGQAGTAIGTMSLKIAFKVSASGEVEIDADHSIKAPRFPSALTRRWVDPKTAAILDKNPKQLGLPLRDGLAPTSELRSV